MLMLSVFAKGEQRTRIFLFLNASVWGIYSAIVGAAVFFSSVVAMVSTATALWRHHVREERENAKRP